MIKTIITLTVIVSITLMSFTKKTKSIQPKTGKYGICNCTGEDQLEALIELTIHENNTFTYIDNTLGKNKLNTSGTWQMNGNQLLLTETIAGNKIHTKWTIDKNTNCIKSRKGLNFERLCLTSACK